MSQTLKAEPNFYTSLSKIVAVGVDKMVTPINLF